MTVHRVCFLIYPGVASYDIAGPAQALRSAGLERYEVVVASVSGGSIESDCPGVFFNTVAVQTVADPIDTLIIPGGTHAPAAADDPSLIQWVERLAARAGRVACVCTGAFLAAAAGLLNDRRAVTHWKFCKALQQRFPRVKVESDPIWIKEQGIWTSAGISAGVDLTLALIEDDHGVRVALQAARDLVVFLKRSGGQSQFSAVLSGQISSAESPIERLLEWVAGHLDADLRPGALAARLNMSPRTFSRSCATHTGLTPSKLVETLRVEAAREAVVTSTAPFSSIAARYGFGDEQRMRRAFTRQLHATPADVRNRKL